MSSTKVVADRVEKVTVFIDKQAATQPTDLRSWYQADLADQFERAGRPQDAEREYRAGLEIDAGDIALRAAYADLLLEQRQERRAVGQEVVLPVVLVDGLGAPPRRVAEHLAAVHLGLG